MAEADDDVGQQRPDRDEHQAQDGEHRVGEDGDVVGAGAVRLEHAGRSRRAAGQADREGGQKRGGVSAGAGAENAKLSVHSKEGLGIGD